MIVLPSLAFGMNATQAYSILRDERALSNAADSVMKHAANAESKVVYNAIDKCQYQNNTDFVNCAHGYFYGYLTVCNGTRYGCETHTLPELAENGILVK